VRVLREAGELRALAEDRRRDGQRIALVPTMGYLHEGHLSLLRHARGLGDLLVMTSFVNPTQFGPSEDLARYPRDEAGDLAKATACKVDIVFAPDAASMYPPGYQSHV
jgi:pantoate--beta-alanine ligase